MPVLTESASRRLLGILASCLLVSALPLPTKAQPVENSSVYVSAIDSDLTLRRVTLFPVVDNLEGIYSRPIESQLLELIQDTHRWDFIESGLAAPPATLIELEEKPLLVQQALASNEAEAAFAASATRGPSGLSIRMNLFLKKDGRLLAQATVKDYKRFEIPAIKEQVRQLYRELVSKLPYDGLILSRQGNRVTINLGKSDGIKKGQTLTVVQIISAQRHPKFNFVLSTEKEILGQLKVLKVDDTLSFAAITSEKERNAIQKLAKISGVREVSYGAPESLEPGGGKETGINSRADAPVSFGNNPREWIPIAPPSFGLVGMQIGFGTFATSISENNETREGSSQMYPNAILTGELWLNPNWIAKMELRQGIATTSNPDQQSSAGEVNHLLSRYALGLGYNFLLRDDFWGPKIQAVIGYFNYRDSVAESDRLTTTVSGLQIGVNGSFPLTDEKIWFLGGGLNVYLSGTARDFRLFAEKKIAENMRASGGIEFSAYQSAKEGADLVQRHTILSGGVSYMF